MRCRIFKNSIFLALSALALAGCNDGDETDDDSDAGTDSDTDTDADSGADSGSDGGTDTDTETDAECTGEGGGYVVEFADPNLEQAVREQFEEFDLGDVLCSEELQLLMGLEASGYGIADLGGIQALMALESANFFLNDVTDLAPLAGLVALDELWLTHNGVTDLAPLVANEGIADGDYVDLVDNPIDETAQAENIAALCDRGVHLDPYCP